jgi:hypothetical protein
VYFSASTALVHGLLPYRDFLLLQPPGILIAWSPFAVLGTVIGDPTAFAIARLAVMLLGAANAALVTLLAGRLSRLAGLMAGLVYAVWITAAFGERSTDFHGPQTTLLLVGLLVLARDGPLRPTRAAVAGAFLGLATSIQLWQGVSVAVILAWLLLGPGLDARTRLRMAAAFGGGVLTAFALVCLPFLVAAPGAMVRYVLLDQVGRPELGVGIIERLRVIEGLSWYERFGPFRGVLHPPLEVVGAAAVGRRDALDRVATASGAVGALIAQPGGARHPSFPTTIRRRDGAAALVLGTAGGAGRRARPPSLIARRWDGLRGLAPSAS